MGEAQITYNLETTLSAPEGGVLTEISVAINIEPQSAGCIIYGWLPDGQLGFVEVRGSKSKINLPFAKPQIYVKYLLGLQRIQISTLGWTDNRGA